MLKSRFLIVLLLCFISSPYTGLVSQVQRELSTGPKGSTVHLKLVSIGHGTLASGHPNAFRIYATADGSKGQVVYARFSSVSEAQRQIDEWVKATKKITSRERNKIQGEQLISDRVVAVARVPDSDKDDFVIIRRDDLNCYLIESASSQVAEQVETLIEHK